ncbi:MAG: hypothetical protein ABWX73_11310 [Marmoricola sp.]
MVGVVPPVVVPEWHTEPLVLLAVGAVEAPPSSANPTTMIPAHTMADAAGA